MSSTKRKNGEEAGKTVQSNIIINSSGLVITVSLRREDDSVKRPSFSWSLGGSVG